MTGVCQAEAQNRVQLSEEVGIWGTQRDQAGFSRTSVWKYLATFKQANSSVSGLAKE